MHRQFKFIKPYKLKVSNVTNNNNSLDQLLSSKKLHQYSYENFHPHHGLHTNKHHSFVNEQF